MTTTSTTTRMEPDWARVPPHVPTYPNPPAYFRYGWYQYSFYCKNTIGLHICAEIEYGL